MQERGPPSPTHLLSSEVPLPPSQGALALWTARHGGTGTPTRMSLLGPLQTPVPLSNTFSHLHAKGISEVTCPGPSLNPTPPDGSSSQGTPVSGQGRGSPSPPPETPLERATPLSAPLLHDELPPAPSMVFKAPRGWAQPFCSLFSCSSLPAPPQAPLQAGPPVGPSFTFACALLSPQNALFYPTNSYSSFKAQLKGPILSKDIPGPLRLDEPPGHLFPALYQHHSRPGAESRTKTKCDKSLAPPHPPHPCPALAQLAQGWTQGVREQGFDAEDQREPGPRAPGLRCALPSTLAAPNSLSLWSDGKEGAHRPPAGPGEPRGAEGCGVGGRALAFPG